MHSYGVRDWTLVTNDRTRAPLVTWAEHGGDRFVAAVENGPLSATQFHPEKSGDAGARAAAQLGRRASLAMSKERARRRAEREREAAVEGRRPRRRARSGAERRGRPQARGHRPAARGSASGVQTGLLARRRRQQTTVPDLPAGRAQRAGLWFARDDWAIRLAGVVVSLLAAPVLHTLLFRRR